MVLVRCLALAALMALGACGHVAQSRQCTSYYDCGEIRGEAQQTYGLPVTVVDFAFSKPATMWTLAATPRIVPDENPNFWYRLEYLPHAGADDQVKFEVKNGLLNSADVENTTQLPDLVETLSPVLRAAFVGRGASSGAPADPNDRRRDLLQRPPHDSFEYVASANSMSCGIDALMAGGEALQSLSAGRETAIDSGACVMQVATWVRTVRLSCGDRGAGVLDEAEMRTIFGAITDVVACSAAQRVFSFKIPEARVNMLIAADQANPSFWATAHQADDCVANNANEGCFPNGATGALFYRTTAPFQTASAPCRSAAQFTGGEAQPVSLSFASACTPVSLEDFAYLGTRHRFAAVMRRSAYALDMPRSVGGDHRAYTFSDGVLQSADIDRTGSLLGAIQLPLTLLGLKD